MCILELIKVLMYEFLYDYIKDKDGNNSRLSFIDTDSLMYQIKAEDVYKDIVLSNDEEIFDFTNCSTKSKYDDSSSKLVFGKMKDETVDVSIEELARLNPKMYFYVVDDNSEHKTGKSIKWQSS